MAYRSVGRMVELFVYFIKNNYIHIINHLNEIS